VDVVCRIHGFHYAVPPVQRRDRVFMEADQGGGQIRFSVPDSHASL
jgi:hypothetical protein